MKGERRKKKKKKKRRYSEEQLDSDDLDLIEDNTGVAVSRKKKYNRVRLDSDEENVDDKDKLANELFHDDEILSDDEIDQVSYTAPSCQRGDTEHVGSRS